MNSHPDPHPDAFLPLLGYDNFYYLFSYEDTRDAFEIPHDLKILKEVFNCEHGQYLRSNTFWECYSIPELVDKLGDELDRSKLQARLASLRERYSQLSVSYQESKAKGSNIPLS
jgi:hypothetical protein